MSNLDVPHLTYGDEPHGLEDLEVVADGGGFSVGISFDANDSDRDAVMATAFAAQFGLRSIDYTRRTYVEPHSSRRPRRPVAKEHAIAITADAKKLAYAAARHAYVVRNKPNHSGMFAAGSALLRLPVTVRAATFTIRNGFHFESALLTRLILEQLAWCYSIREMTDGSFFDVEPHKCVGGLRKLLPQAGRLYGHLSRAAHIVPQTTLRYLDFSTSDPGVTLLTLEHAVDDALWLLMVADYYCVVSEAVYWSILPTLQHIEVASDGRISARRDRPGATMLDEWESRIQPAAPDDV